MATQLPVIGGHEEGFGATRRRDAWWAGPSLVALSLLSFIAYVTWAMLQAGHYYAAPYLSPLYSPVVFTYEAAPGSAPLSMALFGSWPEAWPSFLPASPAFFILLFPASFRMTCYYYRKAYYRALTASPPACSVGPLAATRRQYRGETAWLLFQNLHRYALYVALVFIGILAHDAWLSFFREGRLGIGVGSLVLTLNVVVLSSYTLGCHSLRHLIGGRENCLSRGRQGLRYRLYCQVSHLNSRHQRFGWMSLFGVMATDLYVRLVSMGVLKDFNTWDL